MDDFAENSFCSLCGVLIEPHDGTHIDEEERGLPWNYEVRTLRTTNSYEDPFVTGLGYLNYHREVCADPRADVAYTSSEVDLEAHELGRGARTYWCFPVHETCWQLLLHRLGSEGEEDQSSIAHHLFYILYNTPTNGSRLLLPGHDYGGAADFQDPMGPVAADVQDSYFFHLHYNPNDDFDFDLGQERGADSTDDSRLEIVGSEATDDIFQKFPSEIIMLILCSLPSESVCKLRLSSRAAARATQPPLLSQSFWSSRFSADREFSFVFANRTFMLPAEPVNWRRLYNASKTMLEEEGSRPSAGFRNRLRIWRTLDHILPALRLRLKNEAEVARTPYTEDIGEPFGVRSPMAAAELTYEFPRSELRESCASMELDAGCRLFQNQYLDWKKAAAESNVLLGASCLCQNGRNYISGIRLLSVDDSDNKTELDRAGYVYSKSEVLVSINMNDTLRAVRVRVVEDGIVGLCLDAQDAGGVHSYVFGDFEILDCDGGVAELHSGTTLRTATFFVGLDACKLVSFKVMQANSEAFSIKSPPQKEKRSSAVPVAEIWSPSTPPRRNPGWKSPEAWPPQSFNLCLHVDFGGSDGELLKSLTMVNLFMGEYPHVMLGISFVHNDGSEKIIGRKSYRDRSAESYPCVVQSFPVAGGEGEVIQQIETSFSRRSDIIQAICLRTNFNRSMIFRLYGANSYDEDETTSTAMIAPPGQAISGLFIRLKSPGSQVRDLVADYTECESPQHTQGLSEARASFTSAIPRLDHAKDIMAYIGGFAFGAADLKHLRQIRLSTGADDLSRTTGEISGLQLEYADGKHPRVIGQWIKEYASLELDAGERLIEITSWHGIVNRFSRFKVGPIVGMAFVTSKGKNMIRLRRKPFEDTVCLKHRENPYEQLSTIAWGYNYKWDHVRVLYTPRSEKQSMQLFMSPLSREVPQFTVRERIFLDEVDMDGDPDEVQTITLTFRPMSDEPSGLTFTYSSGKTQTIGCTGERPIDQRLAVGEKLTRLDIGVLRGNRLGSIAFATDRNRELTFMHEDQRGRAVNWPQNIEVHILQRNIAATAEVGTRDVFPVPEGASKFVGLWAVPTRSDGNLKYPMFGTIFENDAGLATMKDQV